MTLLLRANVPSPKVHRSESGDYRYAREDKGVEDEVQLLLFESFGGFGKGVREILRRAADVLQNKLTRAQSVSTSTR